MEIKLIDADIKISASRVNKKLVISADNADVTIFHWDILDDIPVIINSVEITEGSTFKLMEARRYNETTSIKIGSGSLIYFTMDIDDVDGSIYKSIIPLFKGKVDVTLG